MSSKSDISKSGGGANDMHYAPPGHVHNFLNFHRNEIKKFWKYFSGFVVQKIYFIGVARAWRAPCGTKNRRGHFFPQKFYFLRGS